MGIEGMKEKNGRKTMENENQRKQKRKRKRVKRSFNSLKFLSFSGENKKEKKWL